MKTLVQAEPSKAPELEACIQLVFKLINQLVVLVPNRKTHIPAVLSRIGHISRISSFFYITAHFTISV